MYMAAGASITAGMLLSLLFPSTIHTRLVLMYNVAFFLLVADLKNVSEAVAGVILRDHLVDVVITLFDEDGKLFIKMCWA